MIFFLEKFKEEKRSKAKASFMEKIRYTVETKLESSFTSWGRGKKIIHNIHS